MQTHSGPTFIEEHHRDIHNQLLLKLTDIVPLRDTNKISDVDLLYRFLIARKWNVDLSESLVREYILWRICNNVDKVLSEDFPSDIAENYMCGFYGVDNEGRPVYYERPNLKSITYLLQNYKREILVRWHIYVMERARERYRLLGKDRLVVVLDVGQIGVGILTNTTAVGFMKEMVALDQTKYPEHIQSMFIINAPWSFSSIWSWVKPMLDERVQKKINIWKGTYITELQKKIDLENIPEEFGGKGGPLERLWGHTTSYKPPKGVAIVNETSPVVPIVDQPNMFKEASPPQTDEECSSEDSLHTAADEFGQIDDITWSFVQNNHEDGVFSPTPLTPVAGVSSSNSLPPDLSRKASDADTYLSAISEDLSAKGSKSNISSPFSSPSVLTTTPSDDEPRPNVLVISSSYDDKNLPILRAKQGSVKIAQTRGNLIVTPDGIHTIAEMSIEDGHYIHTYLQVYDADHYPVFILKRRTVHREIQVFLAGAAPAETTVTRSETGFRAAAKSMLTTTKDTGIRNAAKSIFTRPLPARLQTMRCLPHTSSDRKFDWEITCVGDGELVMDRRGDYIGWYNSFEKLDPGMVFALAVAVVNLWH